ncbi:MAG TPA: hypothetical protein VHW66_21615 [Stellaceae bacterium]|jgi:intergrase/recombinase|nr:hypothetical protein [Stellaceae bacterium]
MTKSDASKIVEAALESGDRLNEIDALLRSIDAEDEKKRLLRVIGKKAATSRGKRLI